MKLEPSNRFSARRVSPTAAAPPHGAGAPMDLDQASGLKVWTNTFRARSDKVIAVGRILLALGSVWIAWLDSVHVPLPPEPIYFLLIGYLFYAIAAAFLVLRGADWLDGRAFAAAAVIETLVWQVGQLLGFRRARHEIYPDVALPPGRP